MGRTRLLPESRRKAVSRAGAGKPGGGGRVRPAEEGGWATWGLWRREEWAASVAAGA